MSQDITVAVFGDRRFEGDETFFVQLSGATNAVIAKAQGIGTISNNDAMPALLVTNPRVLEGSVGTTAMMFTFTLSALSGLPVDLIYSTRSGSATAGIDYEPVSFGTAHFAAGDFSASVTINIRGDLLSELDESLLLDLHSATNASLPTTVAIGTIVNDD